MVEKPHDGWESWNWDFIRARIPKILHMLDFLPLFYNVFDIMKQQVRVSKKYSSFVCSMAPQKHVWEFLSKFPLTTNQILLYKQ